jgi:hypothetical protein
MTLLPLVVLLLAGDGVAWTNEVKEAGLRAAAEGRPMVLQFRTALCEAEHDPGGQAVGPADARPGHGSLIRGDILSPCSKMEEDVWGHADTSRAMGRFVAVLVPETSSREVHRRYEVARMPTALVTDPWGNEIVRAVGYVERPTFLRILEAIPYDFAPARAAAVALAADPEDAKARFALGRFYETAGLREIAEKYYEKALLKPAAREARLRRDITVARGLNLLKLGKPGPAAKLFDEELAAWGEAPDNDVVMLGVVLARAQEGRTKEARAMAEQMKTRFPQSPYTRRAQQAVER